MSLSEIPKAVHYNKHVEAGTAGTAVTACVMEGVFETKNCQVQLEITHYIKKQCKKQSLSRLHTPPPHSKLALTHKYCNF